MLRRLKTVVQQHSEKSTASPVSEPPTGDNSRTFNEGLVCPECHRTFETIDLLQRHYESLHGIPTVVENGATQSKSIEISPDQQNEVIIPSDNAIASSRRLVERSVSNLSSFVCPQCFQELQSAEALQAHFASFHGDGSAGDKSVDILAMRQEVSDLRATLKEEKRYAADMRKEVDKLHQLIEDKTASFTPAKAGLENESMYYLQQVQMLEAGKALVTTKMLDLEKQLVDSSRANEALMREKDRVIEKSLSIAQDHVQIRSLYDEELSQRAAREARISDLKERVRDLEAELNQRPSDDDVAVLRKELIHAQMLMNDMAQEKEHETGESMAKCSQLEQKCNEQDVRIADLLRQIRESSRQNEETRTALSEKLEVEVKSRMDAESCVRKFEATVSDQARAVETLNDQISTLALDLDNKKRDNLHLETQLQSATELEAKLRSEVEARKVETNDSVRRLDELESRIRRLVTEKEEILHSVELDKSAETALAQLTAENTRLVDTSRDLENQFASYRTESVAEISRQKADLIESAGTVAKLQNQIGVLSNEKAKLTEEVVSLRQKINALSSEAEEQRNSIAVQRTALSELERKLDESKRFETSAHDSLIKLTKVREKLEESEQRWQKEKIELMSQLAGSEQQCASVQAELDAARVDKVKAMEENKTLVQSLEDAIAALTTDKEQLIRSNEEAVLLRDQGKLASDARVDELLTSLNEEKARSRSSAEAKDKLDGEIARLTSDNEKLTVEKDVAVSEAANLRQSLSNLANKEDTLKKELMEKTGEIDYLRDEKQSVSIVKEELADALKATELQAADLRAQLAKVEDILRSTREKTRALLMEKQDQLDKLVDELEKTNNEKLALEADSSAEITTLKIERKELEDQIDSSRTLLDERSRIFESVLAEKLQLENSFAVIAKEKDEEIAQKESRIVALLEDLDKSTKESSNQSHQVERLFAEFQQVNSELKSVKSQFAEEREASANSLNEVVNKLEEKKNEIRKMGVDFASKETNFEEQLRSLTDSLSDMRVQLASRISQVDAECAKNTALESRQREMERFAVELQEEKRLLLERCVLNDKYIEEEKDNCREIQRRLDDAVAAMHELGREHQSFQVDINRHYSRKWADDSLVNQCMKCTKQFSVTVRKHHCRNCGLIFCADCSSKTSRVGASSSKPVRVCDGCYNELQSR